jgi:hypothetical protein
MDIKGRMSTDVYAIGTIASMIIGFKKYKFSKDIDVSYILDNFTSNDSKKRLDSFKKYNVK